MPDPVPVRDAATIIAWRRDDRAVSVLMGQRGAGAAFMPAKTVFPGGAVEPGDKCVPLAGLPTAACMDLLSTSEGPSPQTLVTAAIRELAEETGLLLGRSAPWPDPPLGWEAFAAAGLRPDASALRFVFRAITPPGRPRRFDARFFLVPETALAGSLAGDGELSALRWIPLETVAHADLPFITQVVLAELPSMIAGDGPPGAVPVFDGAAEEILYHRLGGRSPLA